MSYHIESVIYKHLVSIYRYRHTETEYKKYQLPMAGKLVKKNMSNYHYDMKTV